MLYTFAIIKKKVAKESHCEIKSQLQETKSQLICEI